MNLSILSCAPKCYSTLRLLEAAKQRGHQVKILDTTRLSLELAHGEPDLYYKGAAIDTPDAILPRIGTSLTRYGTAVVRQFEQMDVYTPNTSAGISNSRDKLRSLQILSRHDVGIPLTGYVNDKRDVSDALERVGGAPVIIKLLEGTQGVGVILADKPEIAKAIIETLHSTNQQVLLQKFVAESKGKDIRQRLTVSRGYGVADILIPEGSSFVGMTIDATGLREQDVVVLTLRRGSSVISNPKGSRVLQAEDSLLCYGRSAHMKGLIPDQPKKRRKLKPLPATSVTEGNTL